MKRNRTSPRGEPPRKQVFREMRDAKKTTKNDKKSARTAKQTSSRTVRPRAPISTPRRSDAMANHHRTMSASREATASPLQSAKKERHARKTMQRRANHYRWLFIIALVVVATTVIVFEAIQYREARVWGTELFLLEEIQVSGNTRLPTDEIVETMDLAVGKTTMQDVEARSLETALFSAFADLQSVKVVRDVPAGKVSVTLIERQPVARVQVRGTTVVVDAEGFPLDRPFVLPPPTSDESTHEQMATPTIDEMLNALPLVLADASESEEPQTPVTGEAFARGLRVVNLHEAMIGQRQAESGEKPRLDSVDANDPNKVVLQFDSSEGRLVTAWLSENSLEEGLVNLLHVRDYHSNAHPIQAGASSTGESSRVLSESPSNISTSVGLPTSANGAPPRVQLPESAPNQALPSSLIEERYDARYDSTIYVTSLRGGHNG
ncbi:MAG: FtsQ-type POTRA domain-containing protein [Candidatus Poribacteria bacterium]|nr:FtsQ-type POTRA domain-containing protein [Candidatus Poribacteria bacterium]